MSSAFSSVLIATVSITEESWLNATQEAIENNRSSFAVLELHDVIEPEGLLSRLAARGYKLVGPIRNANLNAEN